MAKHGTQGIDSSLYLLPQSHTPNRQTEPEPPQARGNVLSFLSSHSRVKELCKATSKQVCQMQGPYFVSENKQKP